MEATHPDWRSGDRPLSIEAMDARQLPDGLLPLFLTTLAGAACAPPPAPLTAPIAPPAVAAAPLAPPPAPVAPPPPAPPPHVPVPPVPAAPACAIPSRIETLAARHAEGTFDGFSLDGATEAWRVANGTLTRLAVYKTEGHELVSQVDLDPKAVAWSYDGTRQILVDGRRVLVKDRDVAAVPVEGAVPSEDAPTEHATLSDDGRFLVLFEQPAVFDLVDKKKFDLNPLPFAGGSDPTREIDPTGHFVVVGNSRSTAIEKLTFEPDFAVDSVDSSRGAIPSRDASVVLSVPREPFAMDFVPNFEVSGRLTSHLPLSLKPKEPFIASLCPGGNLVAVVAQGSLGFYAADTGKPVWKKPLAQVSTTKPNALTVAKGAPDVLQLSPKGDVLLVKTGVDELLLRLVP
jgi:hypothetical protein